MSVRHSQAIFDVTSVFSFYAFDTQIRKSEEASKTLKNAKNMQIVNYVLHRSKVALSWPNLGMWLHEVRGQKESGQSHLKLRELTSI